MNNSLYGGHDGRPFVIAKSYNTVTAMTADFALGAECTAVQYGEYVLIDCDNNNNPENGQVYRREVNYWSLETTIQPWTRDDQGNFIPGEKIANHGATYIGTITGPRGGTAQLHLCNYQDAQNIQNVTDVNNLKTLVQNVLGEVYTTATYPSSLIDISTGTLSAENKSLVSGKTNTAIAYKTVTLEKADGSIAHAITGFQIPYLVIDFDIEYTPVGSSISITENLQEKKPFYEKWKIQIPHVLSVKRLYAKDGKVYAEYNDSHLAPDTAIFSFDDITTLSTTTITTKQSNADIDPRLIEKGICFVIGDENIMEGN